MPGDAWSILLIKIKFFCDNHGLDLRLPRFPTNLQPTVQATAWNDELVDDVGL